VLSEFVGCLNKEESQEGKKDRELGEIGRGKEEQGPGRQRPFGPSLTRQGGLVGDDGDDGDVVLGDAVPMKSIDIDRIQVRRASVHGCSRPPTVRMERTDTRYRYSTLGSES
jgi:hypothetical protein